MANAKNIQRICAAIAVGALLTFILVVSTACKSEEPQTTEVTNTSVVLYVQNDAVLLADIDTEAVYFPYIPDNGLFGQDGKPIAIADLVPGDLLTVTGNGAMAESYPAQYPGITKMEVIGFDDSYVSEYEYIISRIFPEADPNEVPSAHVEYSIEDVGDITIALDAWSYSIDTDDGTISSDGSVMTENNVLLEGVPDMVINDTSSVKVGFSTEITEASVTCTPVEDVEGVGNVADIDEVYSIVFDTSDGNISFDVDVDNLYTILVTFPNGSATYSFIVKA